MMTPTEIDSIIGTMEEDRMKDIIETFLTVQIIKTIQNHPMDFTDADENYYEIKSRRTKYNTYPTTMITANKYKFAKNNTIKGKKTYFFFCFSDGDYYYEFNKDDLLGFGRGGRCDRGIEEYRDYCYIPINLLKKLDI